MVRTLLRGAVGLAAAAIWLQCWGAPDGASTAQLTVKGNVQHELVLSVDDLRQLPIQHLEDVRVVRESGAASAGPEVARRYTGCLMRDVLDRAQPVEKQRFDLRRSIVVVTAADGYRAVFSWAELYLSPIGEGALVVYERDGKPLPDSEGPLALVSLKDTRPGPRHVKWLRSIDLRLISD
jgi:DMSO/TMAO reductase YedYZ molybdopterin-dependent catalytic subunit